MKLRTKRMPRKGVQPLIKRARQRIRHRKVPGKDGAPLDPTTEVARISRPGEADDVHQVSANSRMVLQSSPDPLPDRSRPYDNGHRTLRARLLDNIKRTPVFPSLGYMRGGELHHHCILPTGKRCPSAARPISRSMRVGPEGKGDSALSALLRPGIEHMNGKILLVALTSRRQTTFPPRDVNNDPVDPITDLPDHPPLLPSAQSVLLGQRIVRQINHRKPRQPRRLDRGGRGEVGTIAFAFPRCTRNARKQQSSPDDRMLDRTTPHRQAPIALDVRSACPETETDPDILHNKPTFTPYPTLQISLLGHTLIDANGRPINSILSLRCTPHEKFDQLSAPTYDGAGREVPAGC